LTGYSTSVKLEGQFVFSSKNILCTSFFVPKMNTSWTSSTVSRHYFFTAENGTNLIWGVSAQGELGLNTSTTALSPTPIFFQSDIVSCGSGCQHTVVLLEDGCIYGWGLNDGGQLGQGDQVNRMVPVLIPVPKGETAKKVACGGLYTAVVTVEGSLYTCGQNSYGQLGHGNKTYRQELTKVDLPYPVVDVICGHSFCIAITEGERVYSWGANRDGECCLGHRTDTVHSPEKNKYLRATWQISAGSAHAMAIGEEGELFSWGWNGKGCLGLGNMTSSSPTPMRVKTPERVRAVTCGSGQTLALLEGGDLLCWGFNSPGKHGGLEVISEPKKVEFNFPLPVESIGCGSDHNYAILQDGSLYLWGNYGWEATRTEPTKVTKHQFKVPEDSQKSPKWNAVFRWLFLGKSDPDSVFFSLPVEVIFHVVQKTFKLAWGWIGLPPKNVIPEPKKNLKLLSASATDHHNVAKGKEAGKERCELQ
jgi:alpha-tubulin suppressor-like RCC1 family protein